MIWTCRPARAAYRIADARSSSVSRNWCRHRLSSRYFRCLLPYYFFLALVTNAIPAAIFFEVTLSSSTSYTSSLYLSLSFILDAHRYGGIASSISSTTTGFTASSVGPLPSRLRSMLSGCFARRLSVIGSGGLMIRVSLAFQASFGRNGRYVGRRRPTASDFISRLFRRQCTAMMPCSLTVGSVSHRRRRLPPSISRRRCPRPACWPLHIVTVIMATPRHDQLPSVDFLFFHMSPATLAGMATNSFPRYGACLSMPGK